MRPKVFIGSSTEGLKYANTMQLLLDHQCEVTIWSQGIFGLSQGTLESLVLAIDKFDFAILFLTPDDMIISRDETKPSPRDNVLFELGLFVGGLGRNRTYIVYDRTKPIKIPSDLAGITASTFQEHSDGNLQASLGACCTQIGNEIKRQGVRVNAELNKLSTATQDFELTNDKVKKLIELIARSRRIELEIISGQFGSFMKKEHSDLIKKDLDDISKLI
ncbi:TIR domain-containing protein [Flavobacterium sp. J27]|uniref:TIR domain-containing protein n=1 Tax=Flavobacterium sp. J27 TaxID=2060419 RepID=UPI0010315663|nr:TIR domain-containing protein [Flavobacterium sp. J27]